MEQEQKQSQKLSQDQLKNLLPYGDTTQDGALQMSFTLPVESGARAEQAARELVQKWGFMDVKIAHMSKLGLGFSFFVVYARTLTGIDFPRVRPAREDTARWSYKEIDAAILKEMGRPIRIVGACTGFDAHTVGLDAILNMKGFDGDIGLERYKGFEVTNLGSQVPPEKLVEVALEKKADAILVSKIISQKDIHVADLRDVQEHLKKRSAENKFILVAGGPRVTHQLALELGYAAGFGLGTRPSDVAYFLLESMRKRKMGNGG